MGGAVLGLLLCLAVVTGCGSDDGDDAGPRATVPETTTSTAPPTTTSTTTAPTFEPLLADPALTVEEQVEAAYLHYWDVVLDAFSRGDGAYLPLVLTGDALAHRQGELERLTNEGHRFQGNVSHDYAITVHSPDEATVVDAERSQIATVDATTGSTIEVDPDEVVVWQYTMIREEGSWRISYVVAYRPS